MQISRSRHLNYDPFIEKVERMIPRARRYRLTQPIRTGKLPQNFTVRHIWDIWFRLKFFVSVLRGNNPGFQLIYNAKSLPYSPTNKYTYSNVKWQWRRLVWPSSRYLTVSCGNFDFLISGDLIWQFILNYYHCLTLRVSFKGLQTAASI